MDFLDPALLARFQFAFTVAYHFVFVPLSIGIGLIMAIFLTKAYRSKDEADKGVAFMFVKIFTATFAIGVATGITMEFAFGTNWANYSRFVGDIFGAPLAAEALFAFFLESVFLGILLFGRNKISEKLYMVSGWLVWAGSCLSALWILIANSWMQTPAGAELSAEGNKAIITDFFAAAFNPSIGPRYSHVVLALLVTGAFVCMAIGAWYLKKDRFKTAAIKMVRVGAVVGIIATCVLLVTAHSSAVQVSVEQPTKLAMMEGMYENEQAPLYLFGWVDEVSETVIAPFAIEGGTSFLATGNFEAQFPGLNTLETLYPYQEMTSEDLPVNLVFQSYHLMVALFGLILIVSILAIAMSFRKNGKQAPVTTAKWLQWLMIISPLFPFIAIQAGWITAEVGRQPWVVYPSTTGPDQISMLTDDGISQSVSAPEILFTLVLFGIIYLVLLIGWVRVVLGFIRKGPVVAASKSAAAHASEESVETMELVDARIEDADVAPEGQPVVQEVVEVDVDKTPEPAEEGDAR